MSDMVSVMKKSAEFEEEKAASLTRMANAQFLEHCTSADKDEIVASELAVMQIQMRVRLLKAQLEEKRLEELLAKSSV